MKTLKVNLQKITILLVSVLLFSSCMKKNKEIEDLKESNENIQRIANERTDVILDYVASMNEIQSNLDSIKTIQKLVNMNFSGSKTEMNKSIKDQIIDDISMLNNLLDQNKKIVADLQKKLNKSAYKNKQLEQLIKSYTFRVKEKDFEISRLNAQLADFEKNYSKLNNEINDLSIESMLLSDEMEEQKNALNTVYYCFGSEEELIENNIIEKTGGFLGIGKSIKVRTDFNQEYFVKEDQRKFNEVLLMSEKVRLLTFHPDGSYQLATNEDIVQKIEITKPTEFWKISKYLIVLVK